ncbi:MAG TPA: sigma-70 family RNA polymerase sigma factor [Gemmataceae bacterium]|nr:sigma-70 family RNA polymerase sigma factor [Gemmataceae bacterium]
MSASQPPLAALTRTLGRDITDGQLLDRFLHHRDESAFAALVERHGPMILGVCRRALGNSADAEDAFQATFIVLMRRAESLAGRPVVGDWLHGVARRTALKARTAAARRRARERTATGPARTPEEPRNDWLPLLDQELARLPEKYRQPIVLCDLEGQTRDEAARQLGWPAGTVGGRLARGRQLLAKRLIRASLVVTGGLATEAGLSPPLVAATVRAAISGQSTAAALTLAEAVTRSLGATRAKVVAVSTAAALLGIGVAAFGLGPGMPPSGPSPEKPPPVAARFDSILGTWQVREAHANGKHQSDDVSPDQVWEITDGKVVIQYPSGERAEWEFTHDATATPRTIDMKQTGGRLAGQSALGLYERKGESLRIGFNRGTGGGRPARLDLNALDERGGRFYVLGPVLKPEENPTAAGARAGRPYLAHMGMVDSAAFSPDDNILATGGSDQFARLWDPSTGRQLQALRHFGWVRTLVWAPDGKTLYTGSDGQGVRQWDVGTGKEVGRFGQSDGMVTALALTRDGKTLAYVEESLTVVVRDIPGGRELFRFSADERAYRLAFSPDGKTLAVGGELKQIRRREIPSGRELPALEGHAGGTYAVAYSSDGKFLASGGTHPDGTIHLWDAATGKEVWRCKESLGAVYALAFSPDGSTLLSGQGGTGRSIRLWDVATGRPIRSFGDMTANLVDAVTFTRDGKLAASAGGWGRGVYLWDPATGKEVSPFPRHHDSVEAIAFSPDSKLLATGSADRTVGLWEASTGRPAGRFRGHAGAITAVTFAPDGKLAASAGHGEKRVRLWSPATGDPIRELVGGNSAFVCLAFSPDGRRLAAGEGDDTFRSIGARPRDGSVWLWDPVAGKMLRQLQAKSGRANTLAFSPDGQWLATAGHDDGVVHIWDAETGAERARFERAPDRSTPEAMFEGTTALAFSPDGRALAAVSFHEHRSNLAPASPRRWHEARAVTIWEVATGKVRHEVRLPWNSIRAVAFAGGRFLVLGDRDGSVRVLDLSRNDWLPAPVGHFDSVTALAVSPDGRSVASASRDTTALAWRTDLLTGGRPLAVARKGAKELDALWAELAGEDSVRSDRAAWALAAAPEAVAYLKERVRPVPAKNEARIQALIADLDSPSFRTREEATAELGRLADLAAPALRDLLRRSPSPESARRAEALLGRLAWNVQAPLVARVLEVLERAGSPAARGLLEELAKGDPAARQTRDAKAALERHRRARH